ncbi:MAG: tape measure protein, partial [Paenisporosarcina sp.]
MASVDDRLVAMKFDNAEFERKVATTIESLDKLQKSLDFANSKKSLEDLGSATRNFNLGTMGGAIEDVSKKFLALSAVAITVLANITTAALHAGVNLVKSLSFDPIIQGFQEYETNLNSIQTILANTSSKGTTLDQVNEALDTLNTYSDQTIYNFAQMAKNIGTFTAAGVDLDTSVNSIKGIANLAAISGSSSEQASNAMYQLSQAISTGTLRLQDWNSVVNSGMGGEVFQKALFETGKALGTIKDTKIDTTFEQWTSAGNTFRGSLEDNWLTAEVLTTTLQSFTGDLDAAQLTALGYTQQQAEEMMKLGQLGKASATEVKTLTQLLSTVKESVASGWSASFRTIFGDFEEAKTLFTDVNNAIGGFVQKNADARNEILAGWKFLGGRTLLIDSLKTAFQALGDILRPIKEAFSEIFPPLTAIRLFEITQKFAEFTEALKPSETTIANIKRIFVGFFGALDIGWEIIKEGAKFVADLFDS